MPGKGNEGNHLAMSDARHLMLMLLLALATGISSATNVSLETTTHTVPTTLSSGANSTEIPLLPPPLPNVDTSPVLPETPAPTTDNPPSSYIEPPCLASASGEFEFGMAGNIAWSSQGERPGGCGHYKQWAVSIPPGFGVAIKIFNVFLSGDHILDLYGDYPFDSSKLLRKYKENNYKEAFAPILSKTEGFSIIVFITSTGYTEFNLSFAAHPLKTFPAELTQASQTADSARKYDCSSNGPVPELLKCDMVEQCFDGRDEEGCPYKKDGSCGDWIPYGNHCLRAYYLLRISLIPGHVVITMPLQAEEECRDKYDAALALLPNKEGIDLVENMIKHSGFLTAVIGLKKAKPLSTRLRHLYKYLWQWGDRGSAIAYEQQVIQRNGPLLDCAVMDITPAMWKKSNLRPLPCSLPNTIPHGFVCMRENLSRTLTLPTQRAVSTDPALQNQSVVSSPKILRADFTKPESGVDQFPTKTCHDGSLVQIFHGCSWQGMIRYSSSDSARTESNLPLFQCQFGKSIHYTLVCDGHDDCPDKSDELSCLKPRLPPLSETFFSCRRSQIIPASLRCDGSPDCFDESDEEDCASCEGNMTMCGGVGCTPVAYAAFISSCPVLALSQPPNPFPNIFPASLFMDGTGMSELKVVFKCSAAEFACQNGLCIPAFLVNNGEKDCPEGEDEDIAGENVTCPGYYRCQDAGLCVHSDFVCDGIHHCPNKDDERYCDLTCPEHCSCEGYAYTCTQMFKPYEHLQVRYLDLSGTPDPALENIHFMEYLQFLNLSRCMLTNVTLTDIPQLRVLDLSFNLVKGLPSLNLEKLSGLTKLDLSGNPFVTTVDSSFASFLTTAELTYLETLTVKNTDLTTIDNRVFALLPEVSTLDLRGNRIQNFDNDVFWGLNQLRLLYVDNYKLCCAYFHSSLSVSECHAPQDELSSCSDLLRLDFFRVFLWSFSVLAILGNAGSLAYRLYLSRKHGAQTTCTLLVANLCLADLLMGVYMMMVGAADAHYRGVYVSREGEWRGSGVCKMGGFLAFVSCEVSAFAICLVTLDRFLVLCFPLKSNLHMTSYSALVACGASWVVGVVLASFPLVAQWEFYGQSGVCLPLPITRQEYQGQEYAFAVFIVLNFVLFLVIGTGQVVIFQSVRTVGSKSGSARRERDMTVARRLFTVVLTDFLCWFPVGLMGILAKCGVPIPGVVNVWVTIFVLPLNSALNPFLYTINGLAERINKKREEQQMKKVLANLHTQIPKWKPSEVEELITICLRSKRVNQDNVLQWLGLTKTAQTPVGDATLIRNESDAEEEESASNIQSQSTQNVKSEQSSGNTATSVL